MHNTLTTWDIRFARWVMWRDHNKKKTPYRNRIAKVTRWIVTWRLESLLQYNSNIYIIRIKQLYKLHSNLICASVKVSINYFLNLQSFAPSYRRYHDYQNVLEERNLSEIIKEDKCVASFNYNIIARNFRVFISVDLMKAPAKTWQRVINETR